jgi:hypothetical protein
VIFWKIDIEKLKSSLNCSDFNIIQSESSTGDDCHFDISFGISSCYKKIFSELCVPPNIYICLDGISKEINQNELENLNKHFEFIF